MSQLSKTIRNIALLSLCVTLSFSPTLFVKAYDSPSATASTTIDYSYTKSFTTSETNNITFNFTLKPVYTGLIINATPIVSNDQNPFILTFLGNKVALDRSTVYNGAGNFSLFSSGFFPASSNDTIQITAVKGFSLSVVMTITGYNNLTTSQEIQSLNDASNNKALPTPFSISSNTTFYGVLTGTDLKDFYKFNFPSAINVTIETSLVPNDPSLYGYIKDINAPASTTGQSNFEVFYGYTFKSNAVASSIILGLSYSPPASSSGSSSSIIVYKITIFSAHFYQSTSSSQPLSGFEFLFIPAIFILPLLRKKSKKF